MGKRGPKPEGQNVTSMSEVRRERPKPLLGMTAAAKKIWKRIVNSYPPDHFRPQTLDLLRAYCETAVQYKTATDRIIKEGSIITQINGVVKRNPWCQERDALAASLASLGTKLQITKSATAMSRSKDGQGNPEKPKSKRAGLMFSD